jgi:Predicted phosphatase/phosphohexomutase
MIKALIFDLDGVLIDSKDIHFKSLNFALNFYSKKYLISRKEHISIFDGLPTKKKLSILNKRGLNIKLNKKIM